ncbi:MAG: zf-HC2 domain-containing protein [Anaerolineae bacterium]
MNNDTHAQLADLLPAYALGCLEEDEADLVTEHLIACVECRETLRSYQSVVENLSLGGCCNAPPPQLKRRLLQKVGVQRDESAESASGTGDSTWPPVPRVAPVGAGWN